MERYTNAHELKDSILLRGQFFPNDPQIQHNHKQNANRIFYSYQQSDLKSKAKEIRTAQRTLLENGY